MNNLNWLSLGIVFLAFVMMAVAQRAWAERYRKLQRQLDDKALDAWHDSESAIIANCEVNRLRGLLDTKGREISALHGNVARKRATIHTLRIDCQVARGKLRTMCSRPSAMVDILDGLEKKFDPKQDKSN